MNYYNLLILFLVIATYLSFKIPKMLSLSDSDKNKIFDSWSKNFSYEVINQMVLFVLIQILSIVLGSQLGFENQTMNIESIATLVSAVICLDFIFYWRHRFYHKVLMLIHGTHHREENFDMTLSFRINPIEMMIQVIIFMMIIINFELVAWQIATINLIFTLQAFYSHLELKLFSEKTAQRLSLVFVVPEFHNKHHMKDSKCNYGFLFSFWDFLFSTADEIK